MGLVITLLIMTTGTSVAGGHPLTTCEVSDAANIASMCSTGRRRHGGQDGVHRGDAAIHTIIELQKNFFFLEPAMVVGSEMALDAKLRDAAPNRRALTTASAAKSLHAITSSNTRNLVMHFGVSPNTELPNSSSHA